MFAVIANEAKHGLAKNELTNNFGIFESIFEMLFTKLACKCIFLIVCGQKN